MLVLTGSGFSVCLMFALYLVQRFRHDAGIVDVGWAAGLGSVGVFYAVAGPGDTAHRVALGLVAGVWSSRLAWYLFRDRLRHTEEDGRYRALRERWGSRAQRNFLIFFQFQALLIVAFSVPYLMVAMQSAARFTAWDWVGVAIGLGAIAGESVADGQLRRWRRDPVNKGRTCRSGLWRYSRHPNYFFEWLHWWCYVLLTLGSIQAIGALIGPIMMLVFLFRITGIPYTERQALLSRGDDYRDYQRTTSVFFPWFPGKSV